MMQPVAIRQTETFRLWYARLRDARAFAAIGRRIERLAEGNPGDVRPVGRGVSELRVDVGPGYRVYVAFRGATVVVLLCGGDKGSQARDIRVAQRLADGLGMA